MCRGISSVLLFYGLVIAALAGGYGEADRWQIPLPTRGAATFNIPIGTETNWTWHSVSGTVGDQRVADAAWGVYERTGRFPFTNALSTNFFCAQVTTSFTYRGWTVTTYWGTLTNGIYTNQSVTNFAEVTGPDCTNCTTNAAITTQSVYCGTSPTGTILKAITNAFGYRDERAALVDVKSEIYGMAENFIDMNSITGTLAQYLTSGQAATSGLLNALTMLTTDKLIEYCGLPHELLITTNGGGSVSTNYIKTWFDYTPWRDLNGITSITQAYGTTTYYFGWTDWTNYYNTKVQTNWGTLTNGIFTSVVWTASFITATNAYTNEGWTATNQVFSNWTFCGTTPCGYSTTDAMYSIAFTNADNIADGFTPADYGWKPLPLIFSNLIAKQAVIALDTNVYAKSFLEHSLHYEPINSYSDEVCGVFSYGWSYHCDDYHTWCPHELDECTRAESISNGVSIDYWDVGCLSATSAITTASSPVYYSFSDLKSGEGYCHDLEGVPRLYTTPYYFNFHYHNSKYKTERQYTNAYFLTNIQCRFDYVLAGYALEFYQDLTDTNDCTGYYDERTFSGLADATEYCRNTMSTNPLYRGTNFTAAQVWKYSDGTATSSGQNDILTKHFLSTTSCENEPEWGDHGLKLSSFGTTEIKAIIRMDVDGGYLFY